MAPISDPSLNTTIAYSSVPTHEVILDYGNASDERCRPPENHEISVHYTVLDELEEIAAYLKTEFEMKDLGKTRYCLDLEIEYCSDGILEDEKEILEPNVPYLSAIGALLYLAQCIRPDISFAVNLLARYSNASTRRHWNGVKDIFRYLKGTTDLGLFYTRESPCVAAPYDPQIDSRLVGYVDAGYLFDPHRARSQTGYVFTVEDTAISWRSTKQTLVATSSNHVEILALHEASHECFWLREFMEHI
ncbi:secreted RxLR effector protein 161-like [Pyrus communis]|uniref:secreted RxLR effector protein 161-like n=1 Tax=Pyrus communis TaxID=23211 RepID=UPI0035C197B7